MKKSWILFVLVVAQLYCLSQLPVQAVLPLTTATDGSVYADTFFNTSAVLKSARIRTIRIFQASVEVSNSSKEITIHVNANGMFERISSCILPSGKTKEFCITDSIQYQPNGRIRELKSLDGKGRIIMRCIVDYPAEEVSRWLCTRDSSFNVSPDADTNYLYYNNKRQLIRIEHLQKEFSFANGSVYYNSDGFPDSIQHDMPGIKSYIFKRKKTRKKTTLLLDIPAHEFKWVYNASGQCTLSQHIFTNPKNWNRTMTYIKNFYYNPNGTLSRVVKETNGRIETAFYSYAQ